MFSSEARKLTAVERAFLEPMNATHRQYEALRAYFIDKVPSKEAAARFGYTPGSFRVLCHQFRADPSRVFFFTYPPGGPGKTSSTPPWTTCAPSYWSPEPPAGPTPVAAAPTTTSPTSKP